MHCRILKCSGAFGTLDSQIGTATRRHGRPFCASVGLAKIVVKRTIESERFM